MFFYAQIGSFGEKKLHGIFFAVIFTFMLTLDHAVDKMSVSNMNEIRKYIINLILFQISDLGFKVLYTICSSMLKFIFKRSQNFQFFS